MKKTIRIEDLVKKANNQMKYSLDQYVQGRKSIFLLVSSALMDCGAYKGFKYLSKTEMESIQSEYDGIAEIPTTYGINDQVDFQFRFVETDDSRVQFYF